MKKFFPLALVFGILVLFFIQAAGTLVESIYILDLMNSKLDEKVLGVLFFFAPLLLLPFCQKRPRPLVWILYGSLLLTRGLTPYLNTAGRLLSSGFATGAALGLFFLVLAAKPKDEARPRLGLWGSAGLALAVSLSALLRTVNLGLDYSLVPAGGWVGWGLGLVLGALLTQLEWEGRPATQPGSGSVTAPIVGVYLIITLVYIAFSAPAVIARWTEGNYTLIVAAVSLLSTGWVLLSLSHPHWIGRVNSRLLVIWNLLFTLCLTGTLLAHRVPFPPTPESPAVVVGAPNGLQQVPLALMLLLFPVIFLDMQVFLNQIQASCARRGLALGIWLGSTALVLLIFAHIFTNVWGYVKPVSLPFRNTFWLPYLLLAGGVTLLIWRAKKVASDSEHGAVGAFPWAWAVLLGAIFVGTLVSAWPRQRIQVTGTDKTSLKVMTFNTQQSNDDFGEKSFDRQLALIKSVSPDILSLQESDSARISLNNNDHVRYYAEKLGYYSYYGPTTVAGTYGTAILSKYPLLNTRTAYTYSDKDEIGTAEADIEVNGHRLTIYDVHPDGSDTAMLAFARVLLERSKDKPYVIALGDYNLRDYEEAYQLIDRVYTNAWTSSYPSKISTDGVDMSGENRIDHIFVSPALGVRNPVYVLVPESATDHAVHWAEVFWKNP